MTGLVYFEFSLETNCHRLSTGAKCSDLEIQSADGLPFSDPFKFPDCLQGQSHTESALQSRLALALVTPDVGTGRMEGYVQARPLVKAKVGQPPHSSVARTGSVTQWPTKVKSSWLPGHPPAHPLT